MRGSIPCGQNRQLQLYTPAEDTDEKLVFQNKLLHGILKEEPDLLQWRNSKKYTSH